MASGVPVIATNVGGNPELIEDGVSGLLVPPRDPAALAEAMSRLLRDPELAANLGQIGKRKITGMFSMAQSIGQVEALYQRLVEEPEHAMAEVAAQ
jgi:glycosyltransferase involved in cell wall biosynthesis